MSSSSTVISPQLEAFLKLLSRIGRDPEWKPYLTGSRIFIRGPDKLEKKHLHKSDIRDGMAFDPLKAAALVHEIDQGRAVAPRITQPAAMDILKLQQEGHMIAIACTCPPKMLDGPQSEARKQILEHLFLKERA